MELHQKPTLTQSQVISIVQPDDQGGRLVVDRQTGTGEVDQETPRGGSNQDRVNPGDRLSLNSKRTGPAPTQKRQLGKHRGRLIGMILGPQHQGRKVSFFGQRISLGQNARPTLLRAGFEQLDSMSRQLQALTGPEPGGSGTGRRVIKPRSRTGNQIDREHPVGIPVQVDMPQARVPAQDRNVGRCGSSNHRKRPVDDRNGSLTLRVDQPQTKPSRGPERGAWSRSLKAIRFSVTIGNSDEGPPSLARRIPKGPITARNTILAIAVPNEIMLGDAHGTVSSSSPSCQNGMIARRGSVATGTIVPFWQY